MAYIEPQGTTAFQAGAQSTQISSAFITNLGQFTATMLDLLKLIEVGASLNDYKTKLPSYLGYHYFYATQMKHANLADISPNIKLWLEAEYSVIVDGQKKGLADGVGGLFAQLYDIPIGTSLLQSSYNGLIQRIGIDPYIQRWLNSTLTPNIPDVQTAWFMHQIGNISDEIYKELLEQNGWSTDWMIPLGNSWTMQPPISMLLDLNRRGLMNTDFMKAALRWYRFSPDIVELVANLAVQYPEPYRLAEMYSKGLTTSDEFLTVARKFGLEDKWSMTWAEAQYRYPDFNTAIALLRRGDINEETLYFWMQRNQVAPSETEEMLKLKDVIPPIQDLIRFAVREAYGNHTSDVQYPAMVTQAKKMGLTEESAEWYWYAHWDRIPINLMFANYHRGLWDVARLERMLKIVDIHPDDRQDIINVAYGPPSIRELGYGWDVGVYTADDIERYRRFGGLSPEDAKKSTTAIVAYRTEGERSGVRTELMYAYGLDKIDEDTLYSELALLNTPAEAIDLWIQRAKLYHERIKKPTMDVEGRIVSSSEALTAFKLGLRDEEWTRAKLIDLAWAADRIEVAIEKAKHDIAEQQTTVIETKERKLTVAQIRSFYSLHLISKEQMEVELVTLGYSPDDAAVLTEVYTLEPEVTPQPRAFSSAVAANMYKLMMYDEEDLYNNFLLEGYDEGQAGLLTTYTILIQILPDLTAMYQKGVIDGSYVISELKKIGVSEYEATLLVQKITDEFQIERLTQEKNLTKAEIIKGVKNNVLTTTQGASLLMDLGYDQNEAMYILAINKVVAAGDPEGYWDMRKVTEQLKKARGEKYMEIPDTLIALERQIKQIKSQMAELKTNGGDEQKIAELVLELNKAELSMKSLLTEKKLT